MNKSCHHYEADRVTIGFLWTVIELVFYFVHNDTLGEDADHRSTDLYPESLKCGRTFNTDYIARAYHF